MDDTERHQIETTLHQTLPGYRGVAAYVLSECLRYKRDHRKLVRVVFSREPQIKELSSIIKKIDDERVSEEKRAVKEKRAPKPYGFDNVHDVIAFTILVPFWTDTAQVIEWLTTKFSVPPPLNEHPLRDKIRSRADDTDAVDGHRAHHYIIRVKSSEIPEPHRDSWSGITCEIQIKSLLSEAWDAKAHDLTYKTGRRDVSNEVKAQFATLAQILRGIDDQSEFLKNLIEEEESALNARRDACRNMFLIEPETTALETELKITSDLDNHRIADRLMERATKPVDYALSQLAAHWSLEREDDPILRTVALNIVNRYKDRTDGTQQEKSGRVFQGASIKWALGLHPEAMEEISQAISLGIAINHAQWTTDGKYQFAYFVADWEIAGTTPTPPHYKQRAKEYLSDQHLVSLSDKDNDYLDTYGFFLVVFGDQQELVRGRNMLENAYRNRTPPVKERDRLFYEYHDYVAVRRLWKEKHRTPG